MIPVQRELRPAPPNVYGVKEYDDFLAILIKIDHILTSTPIEKELITRTLINDSSEAAESDSSEIFNARLDTAYKKLQFAFRCNIVRHLTGESYRAFSIRLIDSTLLQWFTGINGLRIKKAVSKSSIERYEKKFAPQDINNSITALTKLLSTTEAAQSLGLKNELKTDDVFADCTCLESNIHFPVDWVLFRDAARSLLNAIDKIRKQGLKHRMTSPQDLLREMNKLCIQMSHVKGKEGSKKKSKYILRQMKKLIRKIESHAKRYRELLIENTHKTNWSEAQAGQVIKRLDNILNQLPAAIKQAHDRIIGERIVPNKSKIISFYDQDVQIIKRGKAGGNFEFGQKLLLVEQVDGLIIHFDLYTNKTPSDTKILKPMIESLEDKYGSIQSITGDRGFDSESNDKFLKSKEIENLICPKSPKKLEEKLQDGIFSSNQRRRSQTEARIGIFKNVFLKNPAHTQDSNNRNLAVSWCVFSHNLWITARKALSDERELSALSA